jgi:uracil-DNA glycosylase family 4
VKLEAARMLVFAAANRLDAGGRCDLEAGMAKLYASEVCWELCQSAVRIHASNGYSKEYPVERFYRDAPLMVVGEQPGDQEDKAGEPFVGPAGRLLDQALREADIDPDVVFRTNVVKHFRWVPGRRGNRLHKGPTRTHVAACGPWLVAELDMVRPNGIVLLGATAGQAVYGPDFRVGQQRGRRLDWPEAVGEAPGHHVPDWGLATVHPSAVLRSRTRDEDFAGLVRDLGTARDLLAGSDA